MATLSITVPDAQVDRVRDAVTRALGLENQATVDEVRQFLVDYLIETVRGQERAAAEAVARAGITDIGATT